MARAPLRRQAPKVGAVCLNRARTALSGGASQGVPLPGKQRCLFADRLSTDEMKGNQLRLYFSALAYTLIEALRRLGLKDTEWAQAQVNTIRLKLFKIGAMAHLSVRLIVRG
jgi:hypothetical protein